MRRTSCAWLMLLLSCILGCQAQPDFGAIIASFNLSKRSGVSRIQLVPVYVGTGMQKLSKKVIITNNQTTSAILGEIGFSDNPKLPKGMEHSGADAACKLLIRFADGREFAFLVVFQTGPSGAGVEYALSPSSTLNSAYDESLPGNHCLGRGYSMRLYDLLRTAISNSGATWISDPN
jgi:hypothetical protein